MTSPQDEAGFTLVELLIAVVVLGLIMVSLAAGFSVGLSTMNDTSNRLAGSSDAQHLVMQLPLDVAAATEAATGGFSCVVPAASVAVLELTDATTYHVVYGVRTVVTAATAGQETTYRLERYECSGGSVASTRVVARNLAGPTAAAPTRRPSSGPLVGASLTVTEKSTASTPAPYVFTVTGHRRAS